MLNHYSQAKIEVIKPMSDGLNKVFSEGQLAGLTLKNRFIKAATFEGMTPGGKPSERLKQLHCGIAEGGTAMTTLAYCGAEGDGIGLDHCSRLSAIRPSAVRQ